MIKTRFRYFKTVIQYCIGQREVFEWKHGKEPVYLFGATLKIRLIQYGTKSTSMVFLVLFVKYVNVKERYAGARQIGLIRFTFLTESLQITTTSSTNWTHSTRTCWIHRTLHYDQSQSTGTSTVQYGTLVVVVHHHRRHLQIVQIQYVLALVLPIIFRNKSRTRRSLPHIEVGLVFCLSLGCHFQYSIIALARERKRKAKEKWVPINRRRYNHHHRPRTAKTTKNWSQNIVMRIIRTYGDCKVGMMHQIGRKSVQVKRNLSNK